MLGDVCERMGGAVLVSWERGCQEEVRGRKWTSVSNQPQDAGGNMSKRHQ